jgi:hypothetical protein
MNRGARVKRSVTLCRSADVRADVEDHGRRRVDEVASREIRIERPPSTSAETA